MAVNNKTQENQATLYGLAAVLLWSTVATGFKLGLAQLSVAQLLLLGTAISWMVFLTAALAKRTFRLQSRDIRLVCLLGVINPFLYYLILFAAYDRLPAYVAQPLNYTWAITLALLAVPILHQRLTRSAWLGVCLSYVGVVVLLTTADSGQSEAIDPLGVFLALFSTLLWASYWLLNTKSTSEPVAMMFWSFSVGLPLIAITCWLTDGLPALTLDHILLGAWVGLLEMGVTFLLWQKALNLTNQAGRIGQLIFLSPFLSLLLIYFVLGETFGFGVVAGLAIIVAGIVLNNRSASTSVP